MSTEPPIIEVGLTLQFARLSGVTALDIAELFRRFDGAFRTVQHVPEVPPMNLDGSPPQFLFNESGTELPRTWFVSEDLRYLAQFQNDRFSLNWRRLSPQEELEYPGYSEVLRRYREYAGIFAAWVSERFAVIPQINVAELGFVNAIPMIVGDERRRLSSVFTFVTPRSPRKIRSFVARWTELFDEGIIDVVAATSEMPDGQPAATLQLMARRGFDAASIDDALAGIDEMRPHLHSVFENVISRDCWGRN